MARRAVALLFAGTAWLGLGRAFAGISAGLLLIPLGVLMLFPSLIGGGGLVGLAPFRNQEEMLDAVRRRLAAAGGLPIEVVPP